MTSRAPPRGVRPRGVCDYASPGNYAGGRTDGHAGRSPGAPERDGGPVLTSTHGADQDGVSPRREERAFLDGPWVTSSELA